MKLYVASRFANYRQARFIMDELTRMGHEITFDWTRTDQFDDWGNLKTEYLSSEHDLTPDQKEQFAWDDFNGVVNADAVILCGTHDMCGSYIEVGIAMRDEKPIYIVEQERWTIFWALPFVTRFDNYGQLLNHFDNA